jgi:hypothetical protein
MNIFKTNALKPKPPIRTDADFSGFEHRPGFCGYAAKPKPKSSMDVAFGQGS